MENREIGGRGYLKTTEFEAMQPQLRQHLKSPGIGKGRESIFS